MKEPVTVPLSKTYKLGGKEAAEITFREPKVADLIVVENIVRDGGQHAMTVLMMAQLSGATQPEIAEFSIPDYAACDRALRPLLIDAVAGDS